MTFASRLEGATGADVQKSIESTCDAEHDTNWYILSTSWYHVLHHMLVHFDDSNDMYQYQVGIKCIKVPTNGDRTTQSAEKETPKIS